MGRVCTCSLLLVMACSGPQPPTAPDATPVAPETPAPMGMSATGTFVRTGYNVTGRAVLTVSNGVGQLVFSSDFTIASTPGPVVYLNTTNNPNTGQPLRIGALIRRSGSQTYTFQVPTGVQYRWILIWCDPFNVAMAEASIPPTPASP